MVRKVYARDLRDKDPVHTVFRVSRKARQTARSGKPFLVVALEDKTGEVDARVFALGAEQVDAIDAKFQAGDYVLVEGHVTTFHGKSQVVIDRVERLDPEPLDPAEFTPKPAPPPAQPPAEERGGVAGLKDLADRIRDGHLRQLVQALVDAPDLAEALRAAPATRGGRLGKKGSLADSVVTLAKVASGLADQYPAADRDLCVGAALAGGVARTKALDRSRNWEATDEGHLLGEALVAVERINREIAHIPGFSTTTAHQLCHVVLAQDGARPPLTLEAYLVQMAEVIDNEVARGSLPPAKAKDGRRARREEKKKRPEKAEAKPEPAAPSAPKLSFKPLAELAPSEQGKEAPAAEAPEKPQDPAAPAEGAPEGGDVPS